MKENVPITDSVWMFDSNWMNKTGGFARDMTLRDHYAGLAFQAMIPSWRKDFLDGNLGTGMDDWDYFYEHFSCEAYEMADEMLKTRNMK